MINSEGTVRKMLLCRGWVLCQLGCDGQRSDEADTETAHRADPAESRDFPIVNPPRRTEFLGPGG